MRTIFVNLPVKDLPTSKEFFSALGFGWNDAFTDDSAACLVVEENICVMLLTEARFRGFINGEISDAHSSTEVLLCVSARSREEVDDLADRAVAAGGKPWKPPVDMGVVYGRSFADPDGHVWEVVHMGAEAPAG